jgi:hypothetical protein
MITDGGPGWSRALQIYTVELGGHPLDVECRACGHRALVPTAVLRRQRDIDVMTPLKRIRLKCQCGSREWRAVISDRPEGPAGLARRARPTFGEEGPRLAVTLE